MTHYIDGLTACAWETVAKQRAFIWAALEGESNLIAGAGFLHPDVKDPQNAGAGDLVHPTLWMPMYVERLDSRAAGKRVARALYAHFAYFGYQITPDDVAMSPEVDRMWDQLDPAFYDREPVTAVFAETPPKTLCERFAPCIDHPEIAVAEPLSHLKFGLKSRAPGNA